MRSFIHILSFLFLLTVGSHAQNVRIVAAQLPSGSNQNYNGGEGIRILRGLDADIVLIQQLNYSTSTYANFATTTLGPGAEFYRGTGSIPTGILSRYPIVQAGEWTDPLVMNRAFSWAKIQIPGNRFLWAISVQLSTIQANRANSIAELITRIQQDIPPQDYLVVGGNFNCDSRTEASFASLGAVVTIPANFPVDQAGNSNTNAERDRPYDNLLFDADLQALVTPTIIGANSFPNGFVADTRVYTPITDLAPALANDSAAHFRMAVVRDISLGARPIEITASSFTVAPSPLGQITFTSEAGMIYWVQASSTLASGSWQGIGGITAPAGSATTFQIVPSNPAPGQLADPQLGTAPKRFYRVYR